MVCRSLGYGSAAMATTNAYFGRGIGKVYSRCFFTDVTLVDFSFISMQIIPFLLLNLYGRWSFDRKPSIRCKECCVRVSKGHKNKSFKFSCSYTHVAKGHEMRRETKFTRSRDNGNGCERVNLLNKRAGLLCIHHPSPGWLSVVRLLSTNHFQYTSFKSQPPDQIKCWFRETETRASLSSLPQNEFDAIRACACRVQEPQVLSPRRLCP